jgi:hypothetical protein
MAAITQRKKEGKFVGEDTDMDTANSFKVFEADDLTEAVILAEKYCTENIVEYGIRIDRTVTVPVLPVNTAK